MKTKSKSTARHHRKRVGLHQKRSPDFLKAYHPFIPLLAFILVALALFNFRSTPSPSVPTPVEQPKTVLAYATNMSSSGLLSSTNQRRSAAGVSSLKANSKLNAAAQAKANDMASRNYWSHNTPDGNPPWVFINNAGYSYTKAGENLACGFDDSTSVITGWYNSATHKANLLDSAYKDVGFGIINASNYNCGSWAASAQTIVVAMYGTPKATSTPSTASPAPTTSQTQGSNSGSVAQATPSSGSSNPTPTSKKGAVDSYKVVLTVLNTDGSVSPDTKVTLTSTPRTARTDSKGVVQFDNVEPGEHRIEVELPGAKSETTIKLDGKQELFELSIIKPELGPNTTGADVESAAVPSSQPVNRVTLFAEKYAKWVVPILVGLSIIGGLFVLTKHSIAAHRFFVKGEKYLVKHKLIDAGVIILIIGLFYLTRNVGVIL